MRFTMERVRAMVEAATNPPREPWHAALDADTALRSEASGLAADLLDAHAALATERERAEAATTRADAAEAECARLREAMALADAITDMDREFVRGREDGMRDCMRARPATDEPNETPPPPDGCGLQWRYGWRRGWVEMGTAIDRDTARAEADALRAQVEEARAILEGRTVAPTLADVAAHAAAGGRWILRWSDGAFGHARGPCAVTDAREPGVVTAVRWWPLDATGRPTTWPTGGGL
jgi:hypothetical protein